MHWVKRTTVLLLIVSITSAAIALAQSPIEQRAEQDTDKTSVTSRATRSIASAAKKAAIRSKSHKTRHTPVMREPAAAPEQLPPAIALVSGPPEYLSGEASVTVKGNENPIVRLGLAASGVTLVEFPASDRFFALHPGNTEIVTIDESPTKQSDHFFVFRAGSTFVAPPVSKANSSPAASIIAQMRSGMVVTFLIYPVRDLSQMAHRVVILYDRAEIVAARRSAGLAVNLEEKVDEHRERSIRVFGAPTVHPNGSENEEARPRTVNPTNMPDSPGDSAKEKSAGRSTEGSSRVDSGTDQDRELASEARKALKLAITSSKFKNWTRPTHGLSIAASIPKDFDERDSTAIVIVAVSNFLPEPLRIVPGQPELSIETRNEDGNKTLLVEQVKPVYVECSGIGDSIPAKSTLYYALIYRRPVLGIRQHLRVAVGQTNAADDPAMIDLTTAGR